MSLTEEEYLVLKMVTEEGWRILGDMKTDTMIKPRRVKTVPGGNETLILLRRQGFLDYKNRITQAGREAYKTKKAGMDQNG